MAAQTKALVFPRPSRRLGCAIHSQGGTLHDALHLQVRCTTQDVWGHTLRDRLQLTERSIFRRVEVRPAYRITAAGKSAARYRSGNASTSDKEKWLVRVGRVATGIVSGDGRQQTDASKAIASSYRVRDCDIGRVAGAHDEDGATGYNGSYSRAVCGRGTSGKQADASKATASSCRVRD